MSFDDTLADVRLGQCLFGYDRGHRLLATSEDLAASSTRALLIASDFEIDPHAAPWGELTGFPLSEAGLYALSASWPAPEMPRPGCVWTHTVLIPFPVLARLDSLEILLGCFARPRYRDDVGRYASRLPIRTACHLDVTVPSSSVSASVLDALYHKPERMVSAVVPPQDGTAEGLLMAIWAQQWPGLRRVFRFAVRESLSSDDPVQELDLRLGRSSARGRRTDVDGGDVEFPLPSSRFGGDLIRRHRTGSGERTWLAVAARDLTERRPTQFRSFLKRYGADVAAGREAFVGLSSAYVALLQADTDASASAFGRAMLRWFGTPEKAPRLKKELLSQRLGFGVASHGRTDMLLTWMYAMHRDVADAVDCFDAGQWREAGDRALHASNAGDLWRFARRVWDDRDEDWTGRVLDVVASRSDASEAVERAGDDWDLYLALARRNRHLLQDPRPWRHVELRPSLFDAMGDDRPGLDAMLSILPPIDDRGLAAEVFDRQGRRVMDRVVADMVEGRQVSDAWADEAFSRPDDLIDVAISLPRVSRDFLLRFVVRYGVEHRTVERVAPHVWSRLIDGAFGDLAPEDWVRLWTFMFVLGISDPVRGCESLLTSSFEGLCRAAKNKTLGAAWVELNHHLPGRWSYYDWDIYQRLRLAVCKAFLSDRLDVCKFPDLVRDDDMRAELILVLDREWGGRRLLRKIMRKCLSADERRAWDPDAHLPQIGYERRTKD